MRPLIEPLAVVKHVALDWQHSDRDIVAAGDTLKVEPILVNLLTNAVKYTSPAAGST